MTHFSDEIWARYPATRVRYDWDGNRDAAGIGYAKMVVELPDTDECHDDPQVTAMIADGNSQAIEFCWSKTE